MRTVRISFSLSEDRTLRWFGDETREFWVERILEGLLRPLHQIVMKETGMGFNGSEDRVSYSSLILDGIDEPSAGEVTERLLDWSCPGWREWPRRELVWRAAFRVAGPIADEFESQRCTATTRAGTRCKNRAGCRIHEDIR